MPEFTDLVVKPSALESKLWSWVLFPMTLSVIPFLQTVKQCLKYIKICRAILMLVETPFWHRYLDTNSLNNFPHAVLSQENYFKLTHLWVWQYTRKYSLNGLSRSERILRANQSKTAQLFRAETASGFRKSVLFFSGKIKSHCFNRPMPTALW